MREATHFCQACLVGKKVDSRDLLNRFLTLRYPKPLFGEKIATAPPQIRDDGLQAPGCHFSRSSAADSLYQSQFLRFLLNQGQGFYIELSHW